MARAIVGGLLFSTVVSLVFLPTIYTWLDAMRSWPHHMGRWLGIGFRWLGGLLAWPARKLLGRIRPAQEAP
jgi:protein-S-isoprenylcysteine O-methyltransferase Ste14